MLLKSLNRETISISQSKAKEQHGQVTEVSSAVHEWLNHEWMSTYDVDNKPFDQTTFPHIVPEGHFILKSNYFLMSINC